MEPAKIDWKSIDSVFVEDDVYENISAPQWVDFYAPDKSANDEDWFCRPDCKHPNKAEDFLKLTPTSKAWSLRFADVAKILSLGDRSERDANLGKGVAPQSPIPLKPNANLERAAIHDGENQNPNLYNPSRFQPNDKVIKTAIESSNENKHLHTTDDDTPRSNSETPWLKRTLSSRNAFPGQDILNHITDFCHELKRLAVRTKDRQHEEKSSAQKSPLVPHKPVLVKEVEREVFGELNDTNNKEKEKKPLHEKLSAQKSPLVPHKPVLVKEAEREVFGELNGTSNKGKEKKPLYEMNKQKGEPKEKSNGQQRRIKRAKESENIPPLSINLENIKRKEESLLQIRLNPPSPQCFSGSRGTTKVTPLNPSRCRPVELGQSNEEVRKTGDKSSAGARDVPVNERGLDVFWFLKPCRLSTY